MAFAPAWPFTVKRKTPLSASLNASVKLPTGVRTTAFGSKAPACEGPVIA